MGPDERIISWERLEGETPQAFNGFRIYRDLGPERTIAKVAEYLGRAGIYERTLQQWSAKYHWVKRAGAYDDYMDRKSRIMAEARIPEWEAKRQTALDNNLLDASLIRSRLREMMAHPLTQEKTIDKDGRTITIIKPAGWNWATIVSGVKMVAELEAATIAEGLLEADDEDFDPETASKEDLVAFIQKYRKRKTAPVKSSLLDARGDVAT